ncbi:MAG: dihydropteroate synthase [Gemmatimonadetes bacterium]|nr:dihydropteroate synthase [Gemmatimonadota bacterium]
MAGSGGSTAPAPRFVVPGADRWRLRDRSLDLGRPRIMGIVNLTPDSFSDGGELSGPEAALERAAAMVEDGADVLDVGGESTRPGAEGVADAEQIRRILPFVREAVARFPVPLSVDTRSAAVARAALEAGASIVNDVSGLAHDPSLGRVVAESGAGLVLMHMRGEPSTMTERARYRDVVVEVRDELRGAMDRALAAGVDAERVVVDPGLGFAKTAAHNWTLLRRLDELLDLGRPLLVGPSRKRFLGDLLGVPARERQVGTAATCVLAYLAGARVFRVHDVRPVAQALRVAMAVAGTHETRDVSTGDG